ncbi:phosphocholine cytidylyltransferase family protein [Clostridium sp. C2-6-12]|uniref:phosphocholine cytidylyltransferase family protein n=1 Tax=Clostridium sp. C2-6-12 TaxID=2698832 RepID=UPI00136AFDAC|nr:phosphocholine cytidylyltransferase family protein [Clostridium sp. C2-6-12]
MQIQIAVILAAGMGTRLEGITNNRIPKGFLEVNGKTLIHRTIFKLKNQGIKKIYIVTGHLNEFYDQLKDNDIEIITIKSDYYKIKGSMSSLAVLENEIHEDFILLESDIIYEKRALEAVINFSKKDCILISGATNSGDECYIEVKDDNLFKISKNRNELGNVYGELVGVSKISNELFNEMITEYKKSTINQYHYEDAIFDVARRRDIGYFKIDNLIWGEIDDSNHLKRIENIILPQLINKGEEKW